MQSPKGKSSEKSSFATDSLGRFGSDVCRKNWSPQRVFIASILAHQVFEVLLASLVVMSLGIVIIDTDLNAEGLEAHAWIEPVENILLVMYCIEMTTRVYILRLTLFHSALNVMDFTIVVLDVVFFLARLTAGDLPNISFLRVLRLAKLSRVFHVLAMQPQLYIMLEALWSTLQSTMFGCLFIAVALVIYSIIAVEFIRPLHVEFSSTCGRCPYAFDSVYLSMMTFIQTVIIGDDWGTFFLPYMEAYPVTLIFILPVFVTVNFGLMNLIMAVIVDCASQARLSNVKEISEEKEKEFKKNQKILYRLCQDMDDDHSNNLTAEELMSGYDNLTEFRQTLKAMDINKEDMQEVFTILDDDKSGEIKYEEFVQQLYKMKSNNAQTMLVFIKHYVTDISRNMAVEMGMVKEKVLGGIATLQEQVSEELSMIKSELDISRRAYEDLHGSLEEVHLKNKQVTGMHKEAFFTPQISEEGQTVSAPVMPLSASPGTATSDVQLRFLSEKTAAAINDLRCQCENSALLLTSFHSLLPLTDTGADSFSVNRRTKTNSVNVERSESCCGKTDLAQIQETRTECVEASRSRSVEMAAEVELPACKPNHIVDSSCFNDAADLNPSVGGSKSVGTADNEIALDVIDCNIHKGMCQLESHTISHECHSQTIDHETAGRVENAASPVINDHAISSPLSDNEARLPLLSYSHAPGNMNESTNHLFCSYASSFDTSLEFSFQDGEPKLGFEIHWSKNELPLVGGVNPGGAASKRGVLPGDRLAGCNGSPVMGSSREEVLDLLRVRPLTLTIFRSGG